MAISRLVMATTLLWGATAVLVGVVLQNHALHPLLTVSVAASCTLTMAALVCPHVAAADQVLRLGIEIGERRARERARWDRQNVVIPIRR
jgi:hypothetical protein